jgi:uncharacterized protein (TIGR02118 family)
MGNPAAAPAPVLAYGEWEEDTVVKLMLLLYRRPDLSPDDFRHYLQESHMPLVARLPGLRRTVVNLPLAGAPGLPPGCDAVGEDWFDSVESLQAALASPEGQAAGADGPNFLDVERTVMLVMEEEEVPLPSAPAWASR